MILHIDTDKTINEGSQEAEIREQAMTDKIEQELDALPMKDGIPVVVQEREYLVSALLSTRREVEELKLENIILSGNRQADAADIERLERENAEKQNAILTSKLLRTIHVEGKGLANVYVDAADYTTLERENAELKADKSLLETELTRQIDSYRAEVADRENELMKAGTAYDNAQATINELKAEVERLTKEGVDLHNEAEDADMTLATIADKLGITGGIDDYLSVIGNAIAELKTEMNRLAVLTESQEQAQTVIIGESEDVKLTNEQQYSRVLELEKAVGDIAKLDYSRAAALDAVNIAKSVLTCKEDKA